MIEIVAMLSWLTALYLVCVYVNLPNEINLLLFNIFFFAVISLVCEKFFHLKKGKIKLLLKMYLISASGAGYETDFFGTI